MLDNPFKMTAHHFNQYLTYRLERIAEEAIDIASRIYKDACGLSVREIRVLRLIHDQPGIIFSRIVRETLFERSATSRVMTGLARKHLISRKAAGNGDARIFEFRLTKKGEQVVAVADRVGLALERTLMSPLSSVERKRLLNYLDRLTAWVEGDFAARAGALR
jgi:DNA-binding MarR family transcriptional regulator